MNGNRDNTSEEYAENIKILKDIMASREMPQTEDKLPDGEKTAPGMENESEENKTAMPGGGELTEEKPASILPTAKDRDRIIESIRQRMTYRLTLSLTVFIMILTVAAAVVIAAVFMPVVRVSGSLAKPVYMPGTYWCCGRTKLPERAMPCRRASRIWAMRPPTDRPSPRSPMRP